jgi:hypothetical protein
VCPPFRLHGMEFHAIWYFGISSKICRENYTFFNFLTRIAGTLHEDPRAFMISRLNLLRMRNVSGKICRENQNTHCVFSNFFSKNRAVYEIIWKSIVDRGRPQMTIWRMRIAFCIPKATNTHSGCVILIAFPLHKWFHERASVLRYMYITFLVCDQECVFTARYELSI